MEKESLSPFKMNLPTDLKNRIENSAKENRRSLSGEIIHSLETTYPRPNDFDQVLAYIQTLIENRDNEPHAEDRELMNEKINEFFEVFSNAMQQRFENGLPMPDNWRELRPTDTPSPPEFDKTVETDIVLTDKPGSSLDGKPKRRTRIIKTPLSKSK